MWMWCRWHVQRIGHFLTGGTERGVMQHLCVTRAQTRAAQMTPLCLRHWCVICLSQGKEKNVPPGVGPPHLKVTEGSVVFLDLRLKRTPLKLGMLPSPYPDSMFPCYFNVSFFAKKCLFQAPYPPELSCTESAILNREPSASESRDSNPRSKHWKDTILNLFSANLLYCDSTHLFASRRGIPGDSRPAILGIVRFAIRDSVPLSSGKGSTIVSLGANIANLGNGGAPLPRERCTFPPQIGNPSLRGCWQGEDAGQSCIITDAEALRNFRCFGVTWFVTGVHWTGSPKKSIDQIGKNCPKNVRKLCFQPLWTIFGHFSDIFSTSLGHFVDIPIFGAVQRFARYNTWWTFQFFVVRLESLEVLLPILCGSWAMELCSSG